MILLKQFKKVSSTKDRTELEHPNGHKISIAHNSLSPKMKKQLSELPHMNKGGTAGLHDDYSQDMKRQQAQESYTGKKTDITETPAQKKSRLQVRPAGGDLPSGELTMPAGMADGGEVNLNLDQKMPMSTPLYQQPHPNAQYQDQFGYVPPEPKTQPEEPLSNPSIQQPQAPQQQASMGSITGNQLADLQSSMKQYEQGVGAEATAVGAQGQRDVQAARQQQAQEQHLMSNFQQKSQEIDAERMNVYNDLKAGHINPQHFIQSLSGFGQAMTAIGLALGGYGAGINGGPNQAMDFLNKQIDRDVEAQKADMGKKENLLSHLNQQFGNLRDATTMAKAMQRDLYSTKLEEIAANSKNPIAQAKAQQIIADWHMKNEPQVMQMKMNQALLSGQKNGQVSPEILVQHSPLIPEHQRPEMAKQLGKLRALEDLRSNMHESFNQISGKFMNGVFSPNDVESAKQAFTGKLVQLSEGRYNYEAAQNLTNAMFPSKTDSSSTVKNKLGRMDNLMDAMSAEPKSMLEGVGIHLPQRIRETKR